MFLQFSCCGTNGPVDWVTNKTITTSTSAALQADDTNIKTGNEISVKDDGGGGDTVFLDTISFLV